MFEQQVLTSQNVPMVFFVRIMAMRTAGSVAMRAKVSGTCFVLKTLQIEFDLSF